MSLAMYSLNIQYYDHIDLIDAKTEIMEYSFNFGYSMSYENA